MNSLKILSDGVTFGECLQIIKISTEHLSKTFSGVNKS